MHLTDCFIEIFAYVTSFRRFVASAQPPFEQVKETLGQLLTKAGSLASRGSVPAVDFDQARFAVCAWVDEVLVGSKWHHKDLWLKERLQRTYFNTTDAGVEFFQRLDRLTPHQREVREVYYICLALGFTGKFCNPSCDSELENVKRATLTQLLARPDALSQLNGVELFPAAYKSAEGSPKKPRKTKQYSVLTTAAFVVPPLVLAILFVIYHFTLNTVAENFLKTVAN